MPRPPCQILSASSDVPALAEVQLRVGRDVVDAGADDAERDRPDRDVADQPLAAATRLEAFSPIQIATSAPMMMPSAYARNGDRSELPHALGRARDEGRYVHVVWFLSTPARRSCASRRMASSPDDFVRGIQQTAYEGGPHDHRIGEGGDLAGLRAVADAEPHADRLVGDLAQPGDQLGAERAGLLRAPVTPMTAVA